MQTLRVQHFGEVVQGVLLRGNPKHPEPETFRVAIPGANVDVTRTEAGDYWVHVTVHSQGDVLAEVADVAGVVTDARLDIRGRHTTTVDVGEFNNPNLYHLAVRVDRQMRDRDPNVTPPARTSR